MSATLAEFSSTGHLMNSIYEQGSIRFRYRCFDRTLLNGLIQPFQQPMRRDNQDENRATIRMRMRRRGDYEGRA